MYSDLYGVYWEYTTVTGVCLNKFLKQKADTPSRNRSRPRLLICPSLINQTSKRLLESLVCFASKHHQELPTFTERGNVTDSRRPVDICL